MDRQAMMQAMKNSISEVLEQMFFLPLDFLEPSSGNGEIQTGQDDLVVRLGFSGTLTGGFLLSVTNELAWSATQDFLGVDSDAVDFDKVEGTVREMINMLAGNVLSHYDGEAVFDLEMPELTKPSVVQNLLAQASDSIGLVINTPDGCMSFNLVMA